MGTTHDLVRIVRRGKHGLPIYGWLNTRSGRFIPALAGEDPAAEDLRRKLREVEDDLGQLRTDRADKVRKRDDARAAFAKVEGYDTDSDEFKAASAASREVSELDDHIVKVQEAQVGILRMLGQGGDPTNGNGRVTDKARTPEHDPAGAWDARKIIDGDAYKALAGHPAIHVEKAHVGTHVLGEVVSRDAFKVAIGSADLGGLIRPDFRGLNQLPLRPLRMLDLLPVGNTTSASIDYVQEVATAAVPAETAEGALKPELALDFVDAQASVRTIAGWLKVNKQTLADAPMLQGFIDNRLRYKVRRRLEDQVLAGDGVGQNILGILNITGVQAPAIAPGTSGIDALHHGIVAIQIAEHEPTFIAMNPTDWETVRLAREETAGAGTATGGYLMGSPLIAGGFVLFGLPVVVTGAIPAGMAAVGDAAAALVLLREGVNVLISDSDQDDFLRNRVTMLGETRAGVMLWAPDAIAKVALA